jgi:hypothetical protein
MYYVIELNVLIDQFNISNIYINISVTINHPEVCAYLFTHVLCCIAKLIIKLIYFYHIARR